MNFKGMTIKKFHEGFLAKDFKSLEASIGFFNEIEREDESISAYLTLLKDEATLQAEKADIMLAEGKDINPLCGVPIAVKDNILIKGTKTTAASKVLENYKAGYDASVIKNLKDSGVVFLGKTNLDEFAMGSSTENSGFKKTKNPVDTERVPGGSSGGSAAAVAAGMAVAALGSDTGGSIRQPAAFCGVVGFKPTYGAVSRHGLIAMASSLDQIGPITGTVEDAAIVFDTLRGKDKYDATSLDLNFSLDPPTLKEMKGKVVGIPKEYFPEGLNEDVRRGVEKAREVIESFGVKTKEISLPHTEYALAVYYIIMPAEVSTNLARYDGVRYSRVVEVEPKNLQDLYVKQRTMGLGTETKRRVLLGTFVLSSGYYDAYYAKAQKVRQLIQNDFENAFKEVDIILSPTTPTPAFKIGEKSKDPLEMYLSDIFTVPANLAGLPAISIPVAGYKSKEGLPIGFQLIGNHKKDQDVLGLGMLYEKATSNAEIA